MGIEQGKRRSGIQDDPSDRGRVGRAVARVAGIGALVVAVVLVAMLLLGGDSGYRYSLLFENGGQLVPGNEVLVGGQPIGIVDEIVLTDDARAEVAITVDDALHEGTTAGVRSTSLSGVANRYVSVAPGPSSEPEIADGGDDRRRQDHLGRRSRSALQHPGRANPRVAPGGDRGPGWDLHR